MSDMLEFYGICIFAAIFSFFLLSPALSAVSSPQAIVHNTHQSIRGLLDPPGLSLDTLLRSRASPNARLVRAFHLSNTFVSPDPTIHANFLRKTGSLLRAAKDDWAGFNGVAQQAVELALSDQPTSFDTFVRSATLYTTIVGLLDPHVDMTSLASNDVNIVTNLITDLWILSKNPAHIPEHAYPNPLDFVIPAWETLWRVVAVTLAHITRHIFKHSLLTTFLPDLIASRIPPRIETHIADIESAQRSALWEFDSSPPEAFDAARFMREPKACELLTFGAGRLKCAAMNWAPIAAALIVGAILNRADGVAHDIERGERVGERTGWDGWTVRKVP
ncbi:hypothetical protein MSAN_01250200 [Mycena sanguinolenta]|uniref:Cytochrome P450 n=1 Tax=Mycena sanguinolenta TaxID=230812 RepID=A0A8H6YIU5_9AGAR|nr:hypothetical protein MSAN_01250200 [Mycena sanguinolenta]